MCGSATRRTAKDIRILISSLISALAVNVKGDPGPGFFGLARELGRLDQNEDKSAFWKTERDDAYKASRRRLPAA